MDIKNLDSFIQVAELSSFTKAAEKLEYSQSTVSFQIKQLEQSLGVKLFDRVNHTVVLTERGREVLAYAHKIKAIEEQLEKSLSGKGEISGHVRIAMADSLCGWIMRDRFEKFHRQYPEVTLNIISANTEDMFRMLDHNEVDLVYTLDNHIYKSDYLIANEDEVSVHFVAGGNNALVGRGNLEIEQVLDCPCILTEKGMSYRRLLEIKLAEQHLELCPILEVGNVSLIEQLVALGKEVTYLPDFVTKQAVEEGRLFVLDVPGYETVIWKQLLYHKDKYVTPQLQAVIDFLLSQEG